MQNTKGVRGGTPVARESLCVTCRWAHIVKGFTESEQLQFCNFGYGPRRRVAFAVSECSSYDDRRLAHIDHMREIALFLVPGRAGKPAGFVTAEEYERLQEEKEDL